MCVALNVVNKRSFVSEENCFYTELFQCVATSEENSCSYNYQKENEYGKKKIVWKARQF